MILIGFYLFNNLELFSPEAVLESNCSMYHRFRSFCHISVLGRQFMCDVDIAAMLQQDDALTGQPSSLYMAMHG
jgi:hypothetical protein